MNPPSASLKPQIGVVALSSPLEVGAARAPKAAAEMSAILRREGCEVLHAGCVDSVDAAPAMGRAMAEKHIHAIVVVPTSWFEDFLVLDLLEECATPLFFRPLPGMETGALCGTQQVTCYLKQLPHPCASVFGEIHDPEGLRKTLVFLRAAALKSRLRRARIGLAGQRINGMTHTAPNEFMLKKAVGPRVVPLDLPEILKQATGVPDQEAATIWQTVRARAAKCGVADAAGLDSMRLYLVLRHEIGRHLLDALTVGCYPHLMGRVCLAASLLADEGVPLACEGDVHGAVGQLLLTLLSGQPTHNTDWLEPLEDGSVVFSHCGSGSFSLAKKPADIHLASVRLMGQGVCALFPSRPGPITLVSLLARPDGYQCAVMEGQALPTDMVFPGNPLRVKFPVPARELLEWIHREGIGHHWMAAYGHWANELRQWQGMCGPTLSFMESLAQTPSLPK